MSTPRDDILRGTLDLLVLKTLDTLGPQHGYGIARRIEQMASDRLALNQGTVYPALVRLRQRGWVRCQWGQSENNRRARFYSLTRAGRRQLELEIQSWERMTDIIGRLLQISGGSA